MRSRTWRHWRWANEGRAFENNEPGGLANDHHEPGGDGEMNGGAMEARVFKEELRWNYGG